YEAERIAFARRLVATTDRVFTGATSDSAVARAFRLRVAPSVLPSLFALRTTRRLAVRTVSQTAITYRWSALSAGRAGRVSGCDRLPWVKTGPDAPDNFAPLTSLNWQGHVYGDAAADIRVACKRRGVPLHVFAWHPAMARSGFRRNALYLVRPDGYVGLSAHGEGATAVATLTSYLDSRRLTMIPR